MTCCDVIHIISNINNSAAGYDELTSSIMKQCVETYVQPLTFLKNISINQSKLPELFYYIKEKIFSQSKIFDIFESYLIFQNI